MKLTFVVPCYNEEKNINLFYSDLLNSFKESKYNIEIIFINDGSKDNTLNTLKKLLRKKDFGVKIINFSRNFGKEAGIYAGLKHSSGDYVVLIDADMQQPPHLVLDMLTEFENDDDIDVVAYYQEKRIENNCLGFFKSTFYKLMNKITETDFINGASDFRLMKRKVVDAILKLSEHDRFSKGIFSWIGFNTKYMPYVPNNRAGGQTSWSFKSLFNYAVSGIMSFAKRPLKLITYIGCFSIIVSIILILILLLISKLNIISFLCLFILFMFGINFLILGFMGEFIYRSYNESRNRPIYIEKDVFTNEKNN